MINPKSKIQNPKQFWSFKHLNFDIVSDFVLRISNLFSGFTLIELLVVIAVTGFIMAVLFPNFMGARQRARDTQRKSDLSQIQKALELYKMDQDPPRYPATLPSCKSCWSQNTGCAGNIYMRKFPCDPGGSEPTYAYFPTGTIKYDLRACLENLADPDRDLTPTGCPSGASYTIHEP